MVRYFRTDPPSPERLFRIDLAASPLVHDRLDRDGWVSVPELLDRVLTDDNLGWTEVDAAEAEALGLRIRPGVSALSE